MTSKNTRPAENMIGRQTHNVGFFAVPAPDTVTIDGSFDEWDFSGQILCCADSGIRDIFSVKAAAMWDSEYLYLAFVWRDPYPLVNRFHPMQDKTRGWMADSVQLRVFADGQPSWITFWPFEGDKAAVDIVYLQDRNHMDGDTENSIVYYKGVPGEAELGGGVASAYRMAEDGKGFTHEVRLPWSLLYKKPHNAVSGEGIRLGMEFQYGTPGGNQFPMHQYSDNMQPGKTSRVFYWTNVDAWGDLTLLDTSVAEPRRYIEESEAPRGSIPLRCRIPADAKTFTLTINTPDGRRIRNAAGGFPVETYRIGEENGEPVVEVLWDGLDENGELVPPGTYLLSGITAGGIDGYYESSFYNPGTPAWETGSSASAWGADHMVPHRLAAAGDRMVVCCQFAEGGYGTFLLETDGDKIFRKRWSEKRGSNAVAADDRYVYIIPNDWSASGVQLFRMNISDGSCAPFLRDGAECPMPYPLTDLFGISSDELPDVLAMTAAGGLLLMRCSDHTLRVIDPEHGIPHRVYPLAADSSGASNRFTMEHGGSARRSASCSIASDGTYVWYIADNVVYRLDLGDGTNQPVTFDGIVKPMCIAADRDGNFYIADDASCQIVKFAPDGRELLRIGKPGGRARQGKYDRDGFLDITSIAADRSGRVWVTEEGTKPRRISVWNPDGTFCREFIGNAGYAGQGAFIHSHQPDKAYAELNEMVFCRETGQWEMENVMYRPDPEKGLAVTPGFSDFDSGNVFFSAASGEEREYFAVLGMQRTASFFMMRKEGGIWKPIAAIASVADLQHLLGGQYNAWVVRAPYGEWADNDPADVVFWNDWNNDGYVTKDECVILPSFRKTWNGGEPYAPIEPTVPFFSCCCSSVSPDDLSFLGTLREEGKPDAVCCVKPVSFRDGGRPVYLPEGIYRITDQFELIGSSAQLPRKNLAISFIRQNDKNWIAGFDRENGGIRWKYASPYHGVHGSHTAPMPKPGLLIGCLKITGIAENCGDSDVFMVRGNLGEDYFLTTDGMYIDRLTRDSRLPGIGYPDTPEELRKVSFSQFSGRGEHFSGVLTRQADGIIRCSGGLPACQAGNILRIEGLESVRHIAPTGFDVTEKDLFAAEEDNRARALTEKKILEPLRIVRADAGWENAVPAEISRDGQQIRGMFRAMYDENALHLRWKVRGIRWRNGGTDWRILFKTGDCVDFQCSPSANHGHDAADGDFRLLIAPFIGDNAVVLMKQRSSTADLRDAFVYTSPVMEAPFDAVRRLSDVHPDVKADAEGVTVQVSVLWKELGMLPPSAGDELTGDVGIIAADAEGKNNAARIYRSNTCTNLVNDQPGEAILHPDAFDGIRFEG